ncbi:hypothetical protein [Corynebacterium glucuronolyticum]|nr:hypothetical protein [Corynebacterium glucuronolyticum]WKD63928.1 hypothetical protein CGLUCO_08415 [Corynebacterium glucuronolyticum DSM 44120]SMB85889.1 hypothetical protein SAMN05660745_01530 [Corynebacterium glucuronolyticum]
MNKPTFTTTIASPTDVKLPMWAYAIMIGASITAGSSVAMTRLGIPLWGWALEFVIMTLVAYFLVRNNAIEKSDSEKGNPTYVVANRRNLIIFAIVMAILIIAAVAFAFF